MRSFITIVCLFTACFVQAQELFTWSEPASNMAAKTIGFRVTNILNEHVSSYQQDYAFTPEIMVGISAKIMIHLEGFLNDDGDKLKLRGEALYFKYRFYSRDEIHRHFRMAGYLRTAFNNSVSYEPAIDINRVNSGVESGLIFTKLMNKIAVSTGVAFLHATDSRDHRFIYGNKQRTALGYNLSVGKLMLPVEYVNYSQTNLNLILEMPGQVNLGTGEGYLDLAGAVQLIILSRIRIDAGYRFALVQALSRLSNNSFLLRAEYTFFNAYK